MWKVSSRASWWATSIWTKPTAAAVRRWDFQLPASRRIRSKDLLAFDFKTSDGRPLGVRRTRPGDTRTLSLDTANCLTRLIPMGIGRRAWGLPNRCSAPCLRRSRTATPPPPAHRGRGRPGYPPCAHTSSGGWNFLGPPKPEHTLRLQTNLQQPKLFVRQRKLAEYPGRHVVVCPRGFSCRIVETQLDDFSSKPDSGGIFVVLLMPADAFETTSRGCTQVCICGVLAVRRFSQVRDPAA